MFVELIELLRCPRDHGSAAQPHLVASATRTEARHIVEGTLGCPECGAEFRIAGGIAHFGEPTQPTPAEAPSADVAMRLAAFLELTDARWFALLSGRWAAHADLIHRLSETKLVLVNPPPDVPGDVAAAVVVTRDAVPFAEMSAGAAALDTGSGELARMAVRAVRSGGRVVGPVDMQVPEGVTELARDEWMWVGEKAAADSKPHVVRIMSGRRRRER